MNALQKTALVFTVIGAINWGLIGLFNFNLVDSLFGQNSLVSILIRFFTIFNIGISCKESE